MKALTYLGPETLAYRDEPEPEPSGENDCLVEISRVGLCGSDMHAYRGHDARRPPPLILGHEAAGRVIRGPLEGAEVAINPLVTCGTCAFCARGRDNLCPDRQIASMPPRMGAFAQRIAMPARNLFVLPKGFSAAKAALAEPIACGWRAVRLAGDVLDRPLEEARCLVQGGGAIGLGAALCLALRGAREIHVAEPSAERRAIVAEQGDFACFDPSAKAGPKDVDLAIDGVGIEATRAAACAALRPGGAIVHIGLGSGTGGIDARRATLHELAFFGAYTYAAADFAATARAIVDGRLGSLDWFELRPLSEGARAFADAAAGRIAAPKLMFTPNEE